MTDDAPAVGMSRSPAAVHYVVQVRLIERVAPAWRDPGPPVSQALHAEHGDDHEDRGRGR